MAIGDTYVTREEFKAYARIGDDVDDLEIDVALSAASRAVEEYCRRQFNDAGSATARTFASLDGCRVHVNDFSTTTGLVVKTAPDSSNTYQTTVTSDDYILHPMNGTVAGVTGYPYNRIDLVSTVFWSSAVGRPDVEVTAQWGWAAVPDAVKYATNLVAARMFGRRSSPHGQPLVGTGEFVFRISRQDDPEATLALSPYRFDPPAVA